ncbi:pectinesterase inhibitor-like [Syzygium oleosum]|uniref:pectinesterase inhibitor-like n=1 Tax=Syzygium oleosum TaxID=219896 RepID=UPI0024BA41E4|nr:pectinesterase inhibitor-like [Syzygium oleosum]
MDSPIALLALPLVVIFSASLASAESKLVNEVCSKTKDYSSCVAALQLDPRAAKATTLRSLGVIALQIASKDTAGSRKDVDQLLMDPKTSSSWKPVLESCKANIDTAALQFSVASRELAQGALSANYDVLLASDAIDPCLKSMTSSQQNIPPLVTICTRAKTFVSIGRVVTD